MSSVSRISVASLAAVVALLLSAGCSELTEPEACGQRMTPRVPLTLASLDKYHGPVGDFTQAAWSIRVNGVCTDIHSNVEYEVRIQALAGFTVAPYVLYGLNRLRELPDDYSREEGIHILSGSDNFGIRDVYGDGPGEWTFLLTIRFPYQGSTAADSAYIESNIVGGEMRAEWWRAK
jgi:hypothetical protein